MAKFHPLIHNRVQIHIYSLEKRIASEELRLVADDVLVVQVLEARLEGVLRANDERGEPFGEGVSVTGPPRRDVLTIRQCECRGLSVEVIHDHSLGSRLEEGSTYKKISANKFMII